MLDCTYFLYKALLKRFPYVTSPDTEYAAEKLEQIEAVWTASPNRARSI